MKQIRRNVFETNSSSTHSLTIVTNDMYTKWEKGEALFDTYEDKLVLKSELPQSVLDTLVKKDSDEDDDEYDYDLRYLTYDQYDDYEEYLEHYVESFTTPSGDKMVAFGYFGYDG